MSRSHQEQVAAYHAALSNALRTKQSPAVIQHYLDRAAAQLGPGFAQKVGERVAFFLLIIVLAILMVAGAVGFALGAAA